MKEQHTGEVDALRDEVARLTFELAAVTSDRDSWKRVAEALAKDCRPKEDLQNRVRCNHCMSEFDEDRIDIDACGPDSGETCPVCSKGDALMDLSVLEPSQEPKYEAIPKKKPGSVRHSALCRRAPSCRQRR